MKTLIVGAKGYVGSHVVSQLLAEGHTVHALTRPHEAAVNNTIPVYADLSDLPALQNAAAQFDAVGYFAASVNPAFSAVSDPAVYGIIDAMRKGQRFSMQAGSMVFGDTGTGRVDESAVWQTPPPLMQRAQFEQNVLNTARTNAPARSIIYGSLVYGGAGAMIPGVLMQAAKAKRSLLLSPAQDATWSGVHIEDWASLIIHTMKAGPDEGGAWLAAGADIGIDDLITEIAQHQNVPALPASEVDHSSANGQQHSPTNSIEALQTYYGFFGPALMLNQRFSAQKSFDVYEWVATHNDWKAF
jgi:nucleoside-diphosphate-sugar epimerase